MNKIYLDHAATTPLDQRVIDEMIPYFTIKFGNASSLHSYGREAKKALESSRSILSKELGSSPEEIVFTSGGTESNNLALKGIAFANKKKGNHIITSSIEHDCILNSCKWLENQGFKITYLPVDEYGIVNPEDVNEAIDKSTILVSIMQANNEIGTIEPLEEIGKICNENDVYFHTDACQSFTKVPLDVNKNSLNLVTINSHKIYGPKGVGALYIRKGTKIDPLMHGGGHERKLRSGTENVSGIVGFAKAVEISKELDLQKMTNLRDKIINNVLEVPDTRLNGHPTLRLCNNINFSFKYIEGESLLLRLDAKGISVSTGSACSSNTLEPSHVLKALGLPPEYAHGSMRLTIGMHTKEEDIDYVVGAIKDEVKILRKISPFGG